MSQSEELLPCLCEEDLPERSVGKPDEAIYDVVFPKRCWGLRHSGLLAQTERMYVADDALCIDKTQVPPSSPEFLNLKHQSLPKDNSCNIGTPEMRLL